MVKFPRRNKIENYFHNISDPAFYKNNFFHNSIVQWLFIGAFFLNLVSWAVLFVFIKPADLPIIIHYNVYLGVDIIGGWRQVFLLPLTGIFFIAVNGFLAYFLYVRRERIAAYIFLFTALIIQVGIIIANASISAINY